MEFISRLQKLVAMGKMNVHEKMLATIISVQPHPEEILKGLLQSDLILYAGRKVPRSLVENLKSRLKMTIYEFNLDALDVFSTSSGENAKLTSDLLCHFVNKLSTFGGKRPIGIYSIHIGIFIDNYTSPGSLIWQLIGCPIVIPNIKTVGVSLGAAYSDCLTLSLMHTTQRMIKEDSIPEITLQALAEKGMQMIETGNDMSEDMRNIVPSLLTVLPIQLVRDKQKEVLKEEPKTKNQN